MFSDVLDMICGGVLMIISLNIYRWMCH